MRSWRPSRRCLAGYQPNADGTAAADPERGRTASGRFLRETDNLILFGKLNHRANDRHALELRYNFTSYSRVSDFIGEESRRFVRSHSTVGSLVSVVGDNGVNELRVQSAHDAFDRRSHLPESALQASFRIFYPSFGAFGKPWWLPVNNDERKLEVQERFSYLSGNHELRAGFAFSHDTLSEFFAGNADGNYDFDTLEDFAAGTPARATIFFGIMENPNFEVAQQILGAYVQDAWSPHRSLTLQFGARWDGTLNPSAIEHVLPAGRRIPDDLDNFSPRAGVVWSPDPRSVVRGAAGVFYARTPTLLFSTAHSDTGIYPRYGSAIVSPGETGFVPLGAPIDNDSPPAGLIPALSHFDPGFEDPRTVRFNVGYERELGGDLAASLDLLHARSDSLTSNFDANVPAPTYDAFGRPVYAGQRIDPAYGPILVRASPARSDYVALTAALRRRFRGGVQFQAHYTWSRDRSNDDNERSGPPDPDRPHQPGLRLGTLGPRHSPPLRGQRHLRPALRRHRERHLHRPVRLALYRARSGGRLPQPPRVRDRAARRPDAGGGRRRARARERRAERALDQPRPAADPAFPTGRRAGRGALRALQPPEHRRLPGRGTPTSRRSSRTTA